MVTLTLLLAWYLGYGNCHPAKGFEDEEEERRAGNGGSSMPRQAYN